MSLKKHLGIQKSTLRENLINQNTLGNNMFKKGHRPHNKGDSYVEGNYRNRPHNSVERAEDEILEHGGPRLNFGNPYKLDLNANHISRSVNHLKADRVKLF